MLAFRHHVFNRRPAFFRRLDGDAALVLVVLAKAHIAIDLGDDGVILGTTGFEQFGHAGKTPGDVLGPGAFARDARHHVASTDFLLVFDRQDRVHRHRIADRVALLVAHRFAVLIHDDDLGLQVVAFWRRAPVGHDLLRHPGRIIGLVAHGNTRNKIDEPGHAALFGDDRQGIGIPFEQLGAANDPFAFLDEDLGPIEQLVAGAFLPLVVQDQQLHVARHHDLFAIGIGQQAFIAELNRSFMRSGLERLLPALSDAADVEGPHRQLRAGFAD